MNHSRARHAPQVHIAQAPSAKCAAKRAGQKLDKASDPALTGTTVWDGAIVLAQYLTATDAIKAPPPALTAAAAAAAEAGGSPGGSAVASGTSGSGGGAPPPASDASSPASAGASPASPSGAPATADGAAVPRWTSGRLRPTAIELGAGTGAVSLALLAAQAVDSVAITDIPDILPHLNLNLNHNAAVLDRSGATVQSLRWGVPADVAALRPVRPPYDVILGSDLVYYTYSEATPHSKLLLDTLCTLAGPSTLVFLSLSLHHNPEEVERFLAAAAAAGFRVRRILRRELPAGYRVEDVLVVRLCKTEL